MFRVRLGQIFRSCIDLPVFTVLIHDLPLGHRSNQSIQFATGRFDFFPRKNIAEQAKALRVITTRVGVWRGVHGQMLRKRLRLAKLGLKKRMTSGHCLPYLRPAL